MYVTYLDEQSLSLNQEPLSLHQILEILEKEEAGMPPSGADIFISPPENFVNDLGDEDSREEYNIDVNINILPGSILRAPAQVRGLEEEHTILYTARKNKLGDVTKEEMKCVIGALLQTGYLSPARRRKYWEYSAYTYGYN
ncbi:hypothetical protein ANN_10664 [Periplaneta americana]|uniref:Uncharacterized protein n=1 Tax=Periplaneta americana TaxID=6978 RepID=A0ABQ8T2X3_PERAM|nr:hypothetical protein ANN_10664 [Periplaneta americana]